MTDAENTKPQEEQPVIPPKPEDAIPDGIGLSLEQVQELLAKRSWTTTIPFLWS